MVGAEGVINSSIIIEFIGRRGAIGRTTWFLSSSEVTEFEAVVEIEGAIGSGGVIVLIGRRGEIGRTT